MQKDTEDPAGPSFQTNTQFGVREGVSDQPTVGGNQLPKRGTDRLREGNAADTPHGLKEGSAARGHPGGSWGRSRCSGPNAPPLSLSNTRITLKAGCFVRVIPVK